MSEFSRRGFFAAMGAASLPIVTPGTALADVISQTVPDLTRPQVNLESMLRVQASLQEEDVPWWYDGTIYGIVGESEPKPLVRFKGWEVYWVRPLGDGSYELTGHTVSFFYDLESDAPLKTFQNPYSGELNDVTAAVQGGGAGAGFNYSVNGVRPTKFIDQMPDKPLRLQWSSARDTIWMHAETAYPPGLPQPRKQRQTMFAPVADFVDEKVLNLPTLFSSTVFEQWPKWMNMADRAGHVIWHASGAKLRSIDDLPSAFRNRLEAEFPERTTAFPFSGAETESTFQ